MSRHRKWPWVLVGAAVLVLAGIAAFVFLFLSREDPGARPIGEAVEEFRTDPTDDDISEELRPPSGVYTLTGEGSESISFPPVSQADGDTMPMTITHGAGDCWTLRVDYNEAHWQDWDLCTVDGDFIEYGGHTFQRWDLGALKVENTATFVCDPPTPLAPMTAEPGDTFERTCSGTNDQVPGGTTTTGTLTVLEPTTIDVGGEQIEAQGFHTEVTIAGSQTGTEDVDMWFATTTGLPVQSNRSISVDSDSPVGTITYTEVGNWKLSSTEPLR